MNKKRQYRKAKRMQIIVNALYRLKKKPTNLYREKHIKTSQGFIRVLEYGFENKRITPLFIDMHGGGFVLMSAESDHNINQYLLDNTDIKIISIDYPKAPDYPFPAALDAIYEIILYYRNHAKELAIDETRIGIGGHSAGANLATAICLRAKQIGDLSLSFQLLDYPPLDLHTSPFHKPTPKQAISPKLAAMFDMCYISSEQANHPFISPIYAYKDMLTGLPPALVIVAGQDSLHDEGVRYAEMLKNAGVKVEFKDFPNAAHGFTLKASKDTDEALALMAKFIHSNT